MRRALLLLALLGGCASDGSGTRAGLDEGDGDDEVTADAGRTGPSADPDPDRTPGPDAGPDDDGDDVGLADAAPPDAPDEPDEDCGGFGEACCEQGPSCGPLLGCLGGTCL